MPLVQDFAKADTALSVVALSLPKSDPRTGRRLAESEDWGLVVSRHGRLLALVADGVSGALRGGVAARRAAEFARERHCEGVGCAHGILRDVCLRLHELNRQSMAAEQAGSLPYQCMCVLAVVDSAGEFEWAAVGDATIDLVGDGSAETLTAKAEALAMRYRYRAGLPLEVIRICHGVGTIPVGQSLRLYSDGFRDYASDWVGAPFARLQRELGRTALVDDVTLIEIRMQRV